MDHTIKIIKNSALISKYNDKFFFAAMQVQHNETDIKEIIIFCSCINSIENVSTVILLNVLDAVHFILIFISPSAQRY